MWTLAVGWRSLTSPAPSGMHTVKCVGRCYTARGGGGGGGGEARYVCELFQSVSNGVNSSNRGLRVPFLR